MHGSSKTEPPPPSPKSHRSCDATAMRFSQPPPRRSQTRRWTSRRAANDATPSTPFQPKGLLEPPNRARNRPETDRRQPGARRQALRHEARPINLARSPAHHSCAARSARAPRRSLARPTPRPLPRPSRTRARWEAPRAVRPSPDPDPDPNPNPNPNPFPNPSPNSTATLTLALALALALALTLIRSEAP